MLMKQRYLTSKLNRFGLIQACLITLVFKRERVKKFIEKMWTKSFPKFTRYFNPEYIRFDPYGWCVPLKNRVLKFIAFPG